MEETTGGQSDSDVSDSWSVVDFKFDDLAEMMKKDGDKIPEPGEEGQPIEECFELTELIPGNRTGFHQSSPLKYKEINESDGDTDGISVISDEEDYASWKQAAHDNYNNTMKLLDNSDTLFRRHLPVDESSSAELMPSQIQEFKEHELEASPCTLTPNEHSIQETIMPIRAEESAAIMEGSMVESHDDSWQETCSSYLNKYFFTSAVIAAITCIALAQFIRSYGSKDKMTEMLEAFELLRSENAQLKSKMNDLTTAYEALEAKVTDHPIPSEATPRNNLPTPMNRLDLLAQLAEMSSNTKTSQLSQQLIKNLNLIPESAREDFQTLEYKIGTNVAKIGRGGANVEVATRRLKELNERLRHKIGIWRRNNREGVKIVQWFPEETTNDNPNAGFEEKIFVNNVESSVNKAPVEDAVRLDEEPPKKVYKEPVYSAKSQPKEADGFFSNDLHEPMLNLNYYSPEDDIVNNLESTENMVLPEEPADQVLSASEEPMSIEVEEPYDDILPKPYPSPSDPDVLSEIESTENKPIPDMTNAHKKYKNKYPEQKKMPPRKTPKLGKIKWNQENIRPKDNPEWQKPEKNSDRYRDKSAGRENLRENNPKRQKKMKNREKCEQGGNKTNDWFTARGKAREMKRNVEDKAMWYFKKMEMQRSM